MEEKEAEGEESRLEGTERRQRERGVAERVWMERRSKSSSG